MSDADVYPEMHKSNPPKKKYKRIVRLYINIYLHTHQNMTDSFNSLAMYDAM